MGIGGRKPGAGRPKGSRNKASVKLAADIAASGETPLAYMIRVMRDTTIDHDRRDRMAASAAPYVHPRLQTTTVGGDPNRPVILEVISGVPRPAETKG